MSEHPLVTIAIPLLNEARLLPGLLDRLSAQTWPRTAMQVILVDGGSEDETRQIARAAASEFPNILLITNPARLAAAGLNLALMLAAGDFFLRLDARSRPAPDYVERCVAYLQSNSWGGVAGPQVAVGVNRAGRAAALALNHPLGAGGPSYRRAQTPIESDTLYLGAYPTALLREIGGWDDSFAANEDYELNLRLRESGRRLLVAPDIRVQYIARDSLRELAGQYARYGSWRAVTWRKHPTAMRLRHFTPAGWGAGLMLGLLMLPLNPWPLALILLPYLAIITLTACRLSVGHDWQLFPRVWLAFPTIHLAWAAGFWRRFLLRK